MSESVFAYGSNMCSSRFRAYGVSPEGMGRPALLKDHRLRFNKRSQDRSGKASVEPSKGTHVWGVLYSIPEAELRTLDEGEGTGYRRADETAVRETLEEYYRAFSSLGVQAILPYLNQPALLVGPLGAIPLPTPLAVEPIFGPVMESLRKRGYARSELGSQEIRILGADSAFATGIAIRYRSGGEELERAGISYLLRKTDDAWKFVVIVLHAAPAAPPIAAIS